MGFFTAPFAGLAVGGGGHSSAAYNQSPPPAGTGDNAGPARSPLRMLGQDGKNLKKRFVKVVPPGQFPALAPPYAWEPHEREDWKYPQKDTDGIYPKKQKLESRFFSKRALFEFQNPPVADPVKTQITAKHNEARVITTKIQELTRQAGELMQRYRTQKAAAHAQVPVVRHGNFESTRWTSRVLQRSALKLIESAVADDEAPAGLEDPSGTPDWNPPRSRDYKPIEVGLPHGPAETDPRWLQKTSRWKDPGAAPSGLSRQPAGSPQLATALSAAEGVKKQADQKHQQIASLRQQVHGILNTIKELQAKRAAARPAMSQPAPHPQPTQHSQPTQQPQPKPSFLGRVSHSLFGRKAG